MHLRTRCTILATLVAILALAAVPALAENTLTIDEGTVTGGTATVSGTFNLDPITEAQSVGGANTDFRDATLGDAAGINLVDAKIQPLEDGSGLRFIWVVSSLPAQVPPEGIRYTWAVGIGGNAYQLQAKRTNLLSITTAEDPTGHAKQAASQADFFQLRGACTDDYTGTAAPVRMAGCYHLAFLEGSFDVANKQVTMDWPFETRDAIGRLVAPDFVQGAVLEPSEQAGMSIAAAFQAVAGNTTTSDFINGWNPYFIGPHVDLTSGSDSAIPEGLSYSTPAVMTGTTFTGAVTGLSASRGSVWARACNGATCVYASKKLI